MNLDHFISISSQGDGLYLNMEESRVSRHLETHPEIDLIVTDVVMPGMNGRELFEEATRRHPMLKVLFTTGYTRNAIVHNGTLDPGMHLLSKPFTISTLAQKVAEVLASQN